MEMIRLFQLQLEHYEKVEGSALSLEGKANQLSMMVRGNLPAAMQGMVVVPLFAGYDLRRDVGRLWAYDVTGGRYEERDYVATGSGSLHAGTVIKVGYRADMTRDDAINLACRSLWEAADADSATGGPDALRGIYPIVATVTADGWERVDDDELAARYEAIAERGACAMSMPFYVAPEQVMKDRADYARKGIARGPGAGRGALRRRHRPRRREPVGDAAQDQRDLRPHRVRRRRQVQRVRPAPRRRRPRRRPQGLPVLARRRRRAQPRQPVRPDPRPDLHPRDEADGGRDPRRRGRSRARRRPDVPHPLRRHGDGRSDYACSAATPRRSTRGSRESFADGLDLAAAVRLGVTALGGPDREIPTRRPRSRRRCRAATAGGASAA